MPSTLECLATFVQHPSLDSHAASRRESLGIHIGDTIGMLLQGASLAAARRAAGNPARARGSRLLGWAPDARPTQADDIHLISCTTPGSVIVPTALHLAAAGAFQTWGDLLPAVFAGYEILVKFGYAI